MNISRDEMSLYSSKYFMRLCHVHVLFLHILRYESKIYSAFPGKPCAVLWRNSQRPSENWLGATSDFHSITWAEVSAVTHLFCICFVFLNDHQIFHFKPLGCHINIEIFLLVFLFLNLYQLFRFHHFLPPSNTMFDLVLSVYHLFPLPSCIS